MDHISSIHRSIHLSIAYPIKGRRKLGTNPRKNWPQLKGIPVDHRAHIMGSLKIHNCMHLDLRKKPDEIGSCMTEGEHQPRTHGGCDSDSAVLGLFCQAAPYRLPLRYISSFSKLWKMLFLI